MIKKIKPYTSSTDLHVHTKYSDKPTEWFLKRIGAPECFVEPKHVYQSAKAAGMQFVTISDHNCIGGALEIADLPDTFISVELTCRFPENDAKMHILATGITEAQFKTLDEIRHNIYDLREYFHEEDIIYSVAHPLFLVNDKLTIDQFEKLLVLFNRFELINGTRDPRASVVTNAVLDNLTPDFISRLADKHDIEPFGPAPHIKMKTAGSDDHSGQYIASAFTVTPEAADVQTYLNHIKAGRHEAGGSSGNSLHLAHCFYHIAHSFYKQKLLGPTGNNALLGELFRNLLDEKTPPKKAKKSFLHKWLVKRHVQKLSPTERLIVEESQQLLQIENTSKSEHAASYEKAFEVASRLSHGLSLALCKRFISKAASGDIFKTLEAGAATLPIVGAIMPYLAAYKTQHKDEQFIQKVAAHFVGARQYMQRSDHIAWFTDSCEQDDEITKAITHLGKQAKRKKVSLTAITCGSKKLALPIDVKHFEPVGQVKTEHGKYSFPPFLNILQYIEAKQFKEIFISTTGPMGLLGLFIAKLFHLKTTTIMHRHFAEDVFDRTGDHGLVNFGNRYMAWFYQFFDRILVHSDRERDELTSFGIDERKIELMPRGAESVATVKPGDKETKQFWKELGAKNLPTMICPGHIDKESHIELTIQAFESLKSKQWQLIILGDGPKFKKMKSKYQDENIFFIKHHPNESDKDWHDYFRHAQILIDLRKHHSYKEQHLAALQYGLAMIVAADTPVSDWCSLYHCGASLSSLSADSPKKSRKLLAELFRSYINHPDHLETHTQNAAKLAKTYTWQHAANVLFLNNNTDKTIVNNELAEEVTIATT